MKTTTISRAIVARETINTFREQPETLQNNPVDSAQNLQKFFVVVLGQKQNLLPPRGVNAQYHHDETPLPSINRDNRILLTCYSNIFIYFKAFAVENITPSRHENMPTTNGIIKRRRSTRVGR